MSTDEDLITADEIAYYADVSASAVINWRARHEDFPPSRPIGGKEHYPLDHVLAWLDGRRIPRNRLAHGELPGATYGSRLRRGLGREATPQAAATDPRKWAEQLWRDAERLWEGSDPKELAELLLFRMEETSGDVPWPTDEVGSLLIRFVNGYAAKDPHGLWRAELHDAILRRGGILDDPKASQVSTPPSLARLLARLVMGRGIRNVLDPSVDSPATALEVARVADSDGFSRPSFTGLASTPLLTDEVGRVLTRIGAGTFTVAYEEFPSWLLGVDDGWDAVMANPPFNAKTPSGVPARLWPFGIPPESNANFAWLQLAWAALVEGARAAVVLPVSSLSAGLRDREIRATMLSRGAVEAVITLPAKLFATTGVPVAVWLLTKGAVEEDRDVLLIDASEMGRPVSRTQHELSDEDIDEISTTVLGWLVDAPTFRAGFADVVSLAEIRAADWLLLPGVHFGDSVESTLSEAGPGILRAELNRLRDDLVTTEDRMLARLGEATKAIRGQRETTQLREICFIKSGPAGRRLTLIQPGLETVPVVTPRDLAGNRIAARPLGAVSRKVAEEARSYQVRKGDLLFSRVGDLGRVAVAKPEHHGWVMGSGCFLLRVESDDVDPEYLAHFLRRSSVQEWIKRNNSGSAVATLNPTVLGMLSVDVPSWEEQQRVAGILGALDEKTALHRRLAETTAALREELSGALFDLDPGVPTKYLPVIHVLERLPSGKWVSYQDLADVVGSGAQTIGTVLREAVYVPNAYRVLRSNGRVSPEWETNDGLLTAADVPRLLELDGVPFEKGAAAQSARASMEELRSLLEEIPHDGLSKQ
ncbi:N-6 DNA methylase [Phytomonospora endophytica]|uniref:Type I restriction enzyme M protein n=1 Tax=Phytomonospora endophytica TaxID=714109 RepID=A0A841FC22_9ACTN|nr:N-6 DNA methylase [Phytomonospora endophytica]MBB6032935.1 type I restriction enzyme M protein [Phytomonospora endophytica]GIG65161.1 hypothetical protein Pen01_14560 [Phytomonospora endophytica]